MSRLATGGLIDRTKPLSFTFDGARYSGFAGDTLASALVANDVRLVGRSFKYHRPRGILTAGPEEPNALVTLRTGARGEPNTKATTVQLYDGLECTSQNRWPSLAVDLAAVNQLAAPLLVAGFYYKTFMWPAKLWEKLYEPLIRRAAGLGALSGLPDPDHYDREHAFCDLLVIGAGPAGLAAALTAGRAGARVVLVEDDPSLGGRLLSERHLIDDMPGQDWVGRAGLELAALANVRVLTRTAVFGAYDGEYGAIERVSDHLPAPAAGQPRQRLWKIVTKRCVLASGSVERPIVFSGNDRPGVMMASAVSTYINRYAAAPGRRALVFSCSDSGWASARDMLEAGLEVAAVVDPRPQEPAVAAELRQRGVELYTGAVLGNVLGREVRGAEVWTARGERRRFDVDLVAMAGGWNPAIGLGSNLGARPAWSEALHTFLLEEAAPGMTAAGAAAGRFALGAALADGRRA
ncbi:MAG TPA: 2Fe-2S iron-sulfur cluster-binding protein, partial [Phenylobacterium sp.]|uniref:2Fe-2S iron-sulfur cluster-binding protein n=1 Tax=Phenylobacterium sp. TaxID=1871053 RepID=UPI002B467A46